MTYTNQQMDAAIAEYRGFKTVEEYYARLAEDPKFKAAIEAAYERGRKDPSKNFTITDAAGWHAGQYCAPVPPTQPTTEDWREDEATRLHQEMINPAPIIPPPGISHPEPPKKRLTPFGWV